MSSAKPSENVSRIESKPNLSMPNSSVSNDNPPNTKVTNNNVTNTITTDDNNTNKEQNNNDNSTLNPIATTDPLTSFKKRRKKSRKQLMNQTSSNTINSNTKKRNFDQINNDNNNHINIISSIQQDRKKRKLNQNEFSTIKSNTNPNSIISSYKSDRSILPSGKEGQGAAVDVYVEPVNPNKSVIEKQPSLTSTGGIRYRGLKSQNDIRIDQSKPIQKAPKFLGVGPQRAPDNVKITCRFDYQPDICKDWKETGFCGYGASCKFLHDRGDYKAGWQIERDWQKFMKKKEERMKNINGDVDEEEEEEEEENWEIHSSDDDDDDIDTDGLPFACYICRDGFREPVVTKCRHYFCQECAIKKYRKSNACAACGAKTHGIFQTAHKLIKKLKKQKKFKK